MSVQIGNWFVRTTLAATVLSCWAFSSRAQDEQPSLSETLAWMYSTYNPHRDKGGAFGHGRVEIYSDGKFLRRRTSTFTYDGCQFSLHTQDMAPLFSSRVYVFNLRDIDSASIKILLFNSQLAGLSCALDPGTMTCDTAVVEFETRNEAPLIDEDTHTIWPRLQGSDHESKYKSKTFVASFYLDDVEYANRFAKAFRRAIVLCGGKPSPF